jgi:cadmium resistance protein CadD (predicted permease)
VTFANGADNIGIYTPLFASSGYKELLTILIVFFTLLAVWCVAGYYLSRHLFIARTLDRSGHLIVPFVLIGLGLFILYESGAQKILSGFLMGKA